jgi:hypothetical protein
VGGAGVAALLVAKNNQTLLEQASVEQSVEMILRDEFGISVDPASVRCPAGMAAESGAKYVCTYTANGLDGQAQVAVVNESQYLVGATGEGELAELTDPLAIPHTDENGIEDALGYGWVELATLGVVG